MKLPLPLIFVYMTSFIDALGYSFVQPILPYYLEKIGGTASDLGLLTSIYAVTQAISTSLSPRLIPRCRRHGCPLRYVRP